MDISHNYIKSLVDTFYGQYAHIVPLDYQKNYVYNAIYTYLEIMDRYSRGMIVKNFMVDDLEELKKKYCSENKLLDDTRSDAGEEEMGHSFVVNLDVGLGKTITSIITARVVKQLFEDMYNFERELFIKKIEKDISSKTGFNKKILEDVYEAIKLKISEVPDPTYKVGIVARRNLCLEFNEFIKDHVDFMYYPSGRNMSTHRTNCKNKELGELLSVYVQYNYQIDLDLNSLPYDIFIVDEFGNDSAFFGEGENNSVIRSHTNSLIIGLTANASVRHPYTRGMSYKGPRKLKTDEDVRKELIAKKLYSGNNEFTYKFIDVRGDSLKAELDKFRDMKEKSIQFMNKNLLDLSNFKNELKNTLNYLFSDKDLKKSKVDEIIMTINKYKNSTQLNELFDRQDKLVANVEGQIASLNKKINSSVYDTFTNIFTHSHLSYLLESNTILILDRGHTAENIKVLKDYLKENEVKIYNSENFRNMSGTGNVLVGTVSELSKGLNLQVFNNIVFAYIDGVSVNDIYQGIGRLDRIGTITDKEIILMSYNLSEERMNTIINEKDNFNKSIPLKTIQTTGELTDPKLLLSLTEQLRENTEAYEKIQTNVTSLLTPNTEQQAEEKERLEKKMLFVRENKAIFSEMIKQIDQRFDTTQRTISNLMGGQQVDMNSQYISSLLTIF